MADRLSRLPLFYQEEEGRDEYLKFVERSCPIDVRSIKAEKRSDDILNKVMYFVEKEFPQEILDNEVLPYYRKKN